ncbi:MAG: TetR/AcrR family transcriptional regulator [Mycobacteriaceae bacterium]|nr:TetR/AcrR family transcriptional regulator [Mycobacteriaceae bacterium]
MMQPKQDRSRLTRQRLLEATIECLAERGWPATTVGVVAARVGVSRGAAQHHFPTREDLITAALEHMFAQLTEHVTAAAPTARPPATDAERTEAVVSRVVEMYASLEFKAALQVWTAAAADPVLRARILPLEAKFGRGAHHMVVRHLGVDDRDPRVRGLVQATLDMARGLGLADVLHDDSKRRDQIVAVWSAVLNRALH